MDLEALFIGLAVNCFGALDDTLETELHSVSSWTALDLTSAFEGRLVSDDGFVELWVFELLSHPLDVDSGAGRAAGDRSLPLRWTNSWKRCLEKSSKDASLGWALLASLVEARLYDDGEGGFRIGLIGPLVPRESWWCSSDDLGGRKPPEPGKKGRLPTEVGEKTLYRFC